MEKIVIIIVEENMKSKLLIFCFLVCFAIFVFVGCDNLNEEPKNINDKTTEEISYVENKILNFYSMYAKNEYGDIENLNWELIEDNAIDLNKVLDTMILDLNEIGMSDEDIIELKKGVNDLSIAIYNRDINNVFKQFGILYSLLPKYMQGYSEDTNKINQMELKALIVFSFSYANMLDWENAKNTIDLAMNKYNEMTDNVEYMTEYSYRHSSSRNRHSPYRLSKSQTLRLQGALDPHHMVKQR